MYVTKYKKVTCLSRNKKWYKDNLKLSNENESAFKALGWKFDEDGIYIPTHMSKAKSIAMIQLWMTNSILGYICEDILENWEVLKKDKKLKDKSLKLKGMEKK